MWCSCKIVFWQSFINSICRGLDAEVNDVQVEYHQQCALRCYLLFHIGTSIFVDKSATYVDVVYLKYFINITAIHEYNWRDACLVHMYSKLGDGCLWKT